MFDHDHLSSSSDSSISDFLSRFQGTAEIGASRAVKTSLIAPPIEPHPGVSGFLQALFRLLDDCDVRYCLLNSWESIPADLSGDLDIAVYPSDQPKLASVFRNLRELGYRPIQCFNYFKNAYYFVFCWFQDSTPKFVALDVIFEHRRSGLILASGETLLVGRRRCAGFWVASRETYFAYLLAKQTWKGRASSSQAHRLERLVNNLGQPEAERIAGEIFLGRWKERVVAACADGTIDRVLREVRRQPWCTGLVRHQLNLIRYLFGEARRIVRRWFQPTGLLLAVLGPDGAGKSTLTGQLRVTFDRAFRQSRCFHWRPEVFAAPGYKPPSSDPHAKPPRGTWSSMVFLAAFFLDYWVGYTLVIRSLLARSGFVLFDRYFHDVQADTRRYRYGGPAWLPRLLPHLVPSPDLTILLDSDEDVILTRKNELQLEEMRRQLQVYRQLAFYRAQTATVRTDQSVKHTLFEASRVVADYLAQRFERTQIRWLGQVRLARRTKVQ